MTETVRCRCPACGRTTAQTVFRDRLLAPVHWCRSCFATTTHPANDDTRVPAQHSIAECFLVSRMNT